MSWNSGSCHPPADHSKPPLKTADWNVNRLVDGTWLATWRHPLTEFQIRNLCDPLVEAATFWELRTLCTAREMIIDWWARFEAADREDRS